MLLYQFTQSGGRITAAQFLQAETWSKGVNLPVISLLQTHFHSCWVQEVLLSFKVITPLTVATVNKDWIPGWIACEGWSINTKWGPETTVSFMLQCQTLATFFFSNAAFFFQWFSEEVSIGLIEYLCTRIMNKGWNAYRKWSILNCLYWEWVTGRIFR